MPFLFLVIPVSLKCLVTYATCLQQNKRDMSTIKQAQHVYNKTSASCLQLNATYFQKMQHISTITKLANNQWNTYPHILATGGVHDVAGICGWLFYCCLRQTLLCVPVKICQFVHRFPRQLLSVDIIHRLNKPLQDLYGLSKIKWRKW